MNSNPDTNANNNSHCTSIRRTVREILRESRKQRVVIKRTSGQKLIDCSLLLALILSVGAPVLPAFVVLGVLVDSLSVSFKKI